MVAADGDDTERHRADEEATRGHLQQPLGDVGAGLLTARAAPTDREADRDHAESGIQDTLARGLDTGPRLATTEDPVEQLEERDLPTEQPVRTCARLAFGLCDRPYL